VNRAVDEDAEEGARGGEEKEEGWLVGKGGFEGGGGGLRWRRKGGWRWCRGGEWRGGRRGGLASGGGWRRGGQGAGVSKEEFLWVLFTDLQSFF